MRRNNQNRAHGIRSYNLGHLSCVPVNAVYVPWLVPRLNSASFLCDGCWMAERILGYDSRFITISLPHTCPQIDQSECRKEVWGEGVHVGGVPSGQNIHQCGIFDFYNERHVRGSSDVYSI